MFENEEWREIEDLPHYMVSNYGRVKHRDRVEARAVTINDRGVPVVTLYGRDSKTRYLRQINKLVATAFLPPPIYSDETSVWHIDGDLRNCRADNLLWDTLAHVREWNEMHRSGVPAHQTPPVMNNRTGAVYDNAYECGMAEGKLESAIIWRIEKQARHEHDENARYRYL